MSSTEAPYTEGLRLRQAALTAGFRYSLTTVTFAKSDRSTRSPESAPVQRESGAVPTNCCFRAYND